MASISTITAATTAASTTATTPQPRLVKAAHEFEAQMMKEMLKPMTDSDGLTGEDNSSGSASSSALTEFASETLGRALSDRGGFGIANKIISDLTPTSNQKVTTQ